MLQFKYQIINLCDCDYRTFLQTDTPEEVILAILGNFGKDKPQIAVKNVLEKLDSLNTKGLKREKSIKQLEILSKLRNLQQEIINQIKDMAFTYDLHSDIRFRQGVNLGINQGEEKKAVAAIKNMLTSNFPLEQIASIVDVSYDFVKKIADSLKK